MDFMGHPGEHSIDWSAFRTRIPRALGSSVVSKRSSNLKSFVFKKCSMVFALVNLAFVAMATIPNEQDAWLGKVFFPIGFSLTLASMIDVFARLSSGRLCNVLPRTKLDFTFDGLATAASMTSFLGMYSFCFPRLCSFLISDCARGHPSYFVCSC